jgi:uncharacterized protein (TIGR02266 family)
MRLTASRSSRTPVSSGISPSESTPRFDSGVHQRVVIEVTASQESESHFFVDLTGNLSEGGLFVATWRHLPVGTAVDLAISLPQGALSLRGRVRWVRDMAEGVVPGLGVAFEGPSDEQLARIEEFCAQRAPLYVDDEP